MVLVQTIVDGNQVNMHCSLCLWDLSFFPSFRDAEVLTVWLSTSDSVCEGGEHAFTDQTEDTMNNLIILIQ